MASIGLSSCAPATDRTKAQKDVPALNKSGAVSSAGPAIEIAEKEIDLGIIPPQVSEKWPDYEYAWSAQHLIGTYVNLLMEAGKIPASEAEPKIEAAWQAMIDNYPQKPLYDVALRKLGGFYLERGQPQKAVDYFETFCEEYPEDRWRAEILYDLAGAYEDTGEAALAADVYEEFIEDYPDDPQVAQAEDRLAELEGTD